MRDDILAALNGQIVHDAMTDRTRRHPLPPERRAGMRVPEKIGELLVLPVFARGPVAIFEEIDSRYVGEIFEFRQAHEIKWTVGECAGQKRSFSEFREHSSRSALGRRIL